MPPHPPLKDLTTTNITPNTHLLNSACPSPRLLFLLTRLTTHLHDFARETRLTTTEWATALSFLAETGQTTTPTRNEFILLSDILGLSLLVDAINHPTPRHSTATESTVLGPFHTHDAPVLEAGDTLSHDAAGEPMLALCSVRDMAGDPISGVKVDVWETDSTGHYDVQHSGRVRADGRGVLRSDGAGGFWFRAIKPVSYPIPHDGTVGRLLGALGRHPWRPAHVHFMFEKEGEGDGEGDGEGGWEKLVTALYLRGDPYESSDAVFGVKQSLVVDLHPLTDPAEAERYNVPLGTAVLRHDFVLVRKEEAAALRERNSVEALGKIGLGVGSEMEMGMGMKMRVRMEGGLPVADVD
ncbi:hypothetical protein FQN52_002573 [Onygenales sp. PD_12]|nr:hypothetical protein FQN52_002573 [Onygenales sp. PD_12]